MGRLLRTVAVVTAVLLGTRAATIAITAQPDPGWQQGRTLEQLGADALAAITTLRQETGIDRIGLLGISAGGGISSLQRPLSREPRPTSPCWSPPRPSAHGSRSPGPSTAGSLTPHRACAGSRPARYRLVNTPTAPVLTGVEPDSALGVAVPPRSIWFADPRLHVALTAATPLPAGLLSWRHRSPRTTR